MGGRDRSYDKPVPNLKTLICEAYFPENDGPMYPLCMPASMPELRELHARCDGSGFELGEASRLLRAAPNLTALHLHQANARELPDDLKFEKLTLLSMCSTMDDSEFVNMLRLCPNVKELEYEFDGSWRGEEQFSPREAVDAVVAHATHLIEFRLDLTERKRLGYPGFTREDMQAGKLILEERGVRCVFTIDYDHERREQIYVDRV